MEKRRNVKTAPVVIQREAVFGVQERIPGVSMVRARAVADFGLRDQVRDRAREAAAFPAPGPWPALATGRRLPSDL